MNTLKWIKINLSKILLTGAVVALFTGLWMSLGLPVALIALAIAFTIISCNI